ncbi:zinc-dependent alcohol dehydrogenase family protein [Stieleria mannarensis]|uniref:zinc-dependent alcohol dehydrogenase family protein n=1 Tax=Stieleria mannarensis TaxID=2755585 RepID=UPI00257101E0|nr:zinc-dependent alcohol dehydrogenase family protein [Rhodopirellula sp. JC639]
MMNAMVLPGIVSLDDCRTPLEFTSLPIPDPGAGQVLVKVLSCGVCHTELDEIEGRTAPSQFPVVPGHEIVGRIVTLGAGVAQWTVGRRVGIGWIYASSGTSQENLSPEFRATGRDVNGGYAEYMCADARYIFPIPETFGDAEAAPLLCAGGIGYRALRLANLSDGDPLGLTGFGGSAHLVLQLVRHLYPRTKVYVFARDQRSRQFALEMGAHWAGASEATSPEPLQAIIDTTPAWKPIVEALRNLRPAGRLVINAIRKEDADKQELSRLSYHDHLWMEKEIKSVANITGNDLAEFLPIAAQIPIRPKVETYTLRQANQALVELKHGHVRGAKVIVMDQT